jgi:hypothetical protein
MPPVALLAFAAALGGQDAFGGEPGGERGSADEIPPAAPEECTIKGDDGVWRTCSDVLQAKEGARQHLPTGDVANVEPVREAANDRDARALSTAFVVQKTKLEIEIEKARLDPTLPLLALRIDVERARDALQALESKGTGGTVRDEAEQRVAEAELILDAIERIAIHRMDVCSQRRGNKPLLKTFRMTAAGPVLLSAADMMARLPIVDPPGCERIILIDADVVLRVKRRHELRRMLATTSFGYHEVQQRRELERELKELTRELDKDANPALSAPGVKDPYR